MKYVAFIDTLGFKKKLQNISHDEAKNIIKGFNQEIYHLWQEMGYDHDPDIRGRTFSDSLVIFTRDTNTQSLTKLLDFLIRLYRISIIKCDLPLRGGIAVGEYDDIQATEFDNLQKGIVVGNAFIDAYALESSYGIKGSKILFKQEIKLKINSSIDQYTTKSVKKDDRKNEIYELKWGDINFLVENNYSSLEQFVRLACESKWLDHYYGTLDTFLTNESKEDKRDIYLKIIYFINKHYRYNDLDNFIENFMKADCSSQLKTNFLSFIREHLK
jgi:hypothetical protein